VLHAYDVNGKLLREAELPGLGTIMALDGRPDATQTYYMYTSFTEPRAVYRYDLASGVSTPWKLPQVAFDRAGLETRQVFYPAQDGQKIPMFIVGKRGFANDKTRPTILTATASVVCLRRPGTIR
jgi:prolyl oligopeptidase